MAGTIISYPQSGDTDRNSFITLLQKTSKGYMGLSLTHYGDTGADPSIEVGSYIEVNGAVYSFGDSLAITGDSGDTGDVWFKIVPDGDSCSFQISGDSGTWSASKYGWYGTGDSANHRYIGGSDRDAAGDYNDKWLFNDTDKGNQTIKILGDGTLGDLNISGSLTSSGSSRVRVTKNDAQNINNTTATIVQYDDEVFDNLGEFATYKFTAKETGYYHVSASLLLTTPSQWTANKTFEIRIYKNAGLYSKGRNIVKESSTGRAYKSEISDLVYLTATEYLDIRAYHDSGYTQATSTDVYSNYLAIHRIS